MQYADSITKEIDCTTSRLTITIYPQDDENFFNDYIDNINNCYRLVYSDSYDLSEFRGGLVEIYVEQFTMKKELEDGSILNCDFSLENKATIINRGRTINDNSAILIVKLFQLINMKPNDFGILPIDINEIDNLKSILVVPPAKKLILTNYRSKLNLERDYTNLVVKGELNSFYDTRNSESILPQTLGEGNKKFTVISINAIVDTGLSTIGIDNTQIGSNDSILDLSNVSEPVLDDLFWKDFYVNHVILPKEISTKEVNCFYGYHGTLLNKSTLSHYSPIIEIQPNNEIVYPKQRESCFLGEVQLEVIKKDGNDTLERSLYLFIELTIPGTINETDLNAKLILKEMEIIQTSGHFDLRFYEGKPIDNDIGVDQVVLAKKSDDEWKLVKIPIGNVTEIIETFNAILGEVTEKEGKKYLTVHPYIAFRNNHVNALISPITIYRDNGAVINSIKTTNCYYKIGNELVSKVNVTTEGTVPKEIYQLLPLPIKMVENTGQGCYLEKGNSDSPLVSINAFPAEDIGLESRFQSSIDLSTVDFN